MIRNVVVGKLRDGIPLGDIEPGLAAIAGLTPAGLVAVHVGTDLRLREQAWDFSITSDFVDVEAYRQYDLDLEHNRIRAELFGPLCAQFARVQFEITDPA